MRITQGPKVFGSILDSCILICHIHCKSRLCLFIICTALFGLIIWSYQVDPTLNKLTATSKALIRFRVPWVPNNPYQASEKFPTRNTTPQQAQMASSAQAWSAWVTNNRYQCWYHCNGHSPSAMPSPLTEWHDTSHSQMGSSWNMHGGQDVTMGQAQHLPCCSATNTAMTAWYPQEFDSSHFWALAFWWHYHSQLC